MNEKSELTFFQSIEVFTGFLVRNYSQFQLLLPIIVSVNFQPEKKTKVKTSRKESI